MKMNARMNTRMWVALGILCAYIIFAIVMAYLDPTGLIFGSLSFIAGGFGGYYLKSGLLERQIEKATEESLFPEKTE